MKSLSINDMLTGKSSKYPLAVAVAKRAREINNEALQDNVILDKKAVNIAFEEFKNNEYKIISPE